MATHMNAQKLATLRNNLSEMLVDFTFEMFLIEAKKLGLITQFDSPERQVIFKREDCSETYDHYALVELSTGESLQLWAQTTRYKGNAGKTEANKTYEIRETLVECLTLRKWLIKEKVNFRTIHFTLGDPSYTYEWFSTAKDNSFDLSLYPNQLCDVQIFDILLNAAKDCTIEAEVYDIFKDVYGEPRSELGKYTHAMVNALLEWAKMGFAVQHNADLQVKLLLDNEAALSSRQQLSIAESKHGGEGIKNRAISLICGVDETHDEVMLQTLNLLLAKNPFLSAALKALDNWNAWTTNAISSPIDENLDDYIQVLWKSKSVDRLLIRRLLLRLHSENSIDYIQDIPVGGVDEHTLYQGEHSDAQVVQYSQNLYWE